MNPKFEEQSQHNKKKRRTTMKDGNEILLGFEKFENRIKNILSTKRISRKRKRSRTITLSTSSSVCSITSLSSLNVSKDNRKKKRMKSQCQHCQKKSSHTNEFGSSSKNRNNITKKFHYEEKLKHYNGKLPLTDYVKKEEMEENSTKKIASLLNDREIEKNIRIKIENSSLIDEEKAVESVHETLVSKWSVILKDGLLDETKDELLSEYRLTNNYEFLKAPKLNIDLQPFLNDKHIKNDQRQISIQNRVSSALIAIDKVLNHILNSNEDSELIANIVDILADAGVILADTHHLLSVKRRFDVISGFDMGDIADFSCIQNSLFSEQFLNIVKSARSLVKQDAGNKDQTIDGRNKGMKNSEKETENGMRNLEKSITTCSKNLGDERLNKLKNSENKFINVNKKLEIKIDDVENFEKKINNDAKESQMKVNEVINTTEMMNKRTNNLEEKTSEITKNLENTSNAVNSNSERNISNEAKSPENKKDDAKNSEKQVSDSTHFSPHPKNDLIPKEKICEESSAHEKSREKFQSDEKNDKKSRQEKSKECQVNEKITNESETVENVSKKPDSNEKISKESQPDKIMQEINVDSKNEIAEAMMINLKNVSLRIIDEITAVYQKRIEALQPEHTKFKADVKVVKGCDEMTPFPGIQQALKGAYLAQGYVEVAAETMLHSLAPSTMKLYERPIRFWWEFCAKRKINVYQGTVQDVIQFFVDYENIITSHNVLATWRSALGEFTIEDLGKSKSIANYFKGFKFIKTEKR